MAELPTDTPPVTHEDREHVRRFRLVAQRNENRINADPELKELLETLQRSRKARREEDEGPEAGRQGGRRSERPAR